jgi:hypothetical protein
VSGVAVHEYTHFYLFQEAGCSTDLNVLSEGDPETGLAAASVEAHCNGTAEELQRLDQTQSMVESVGYQVLPLYMLLGLMLALTIINRQPRRRRRRDVV